MNTTLFTTAQYAVYNKIKKQLQTKYTVVVTDAASMLFYNSAKQLHNEHGAAKQHAWYSNENEYYLFGTQLTEANWELQCAVLLQARVTKLVLACAAANCAFDDATISNIANGVQQIDCTAHV
jgi:hypothetical protein